MVSQPVAQQNADLPARESAVTILNRNIFDRVMSRMTDANEHAIQRAVCVWSPKHPPPVDRQAIAIFPEHGYMSFSVQLSRSRLYASLSVHTGEVRIGIVVPSDFAVAMRDLIMHPGRAEPPTRTLDFGETGTLFDWIITTGACSTETMLAAMSSPTVSDAVADYIAHRAHNLYFSILEILAARCGVTYTAAGAFERDDLDHYFFTVEGPEQPERIQERVDHLYGVMACVREEDGAWCYLVAAPKTERDVPNRFANMIGSGYYVKAHGLAQPDSRKAWQE